MRKKDSKEFGSVRLFVTQLPPIRALEILPDVARIALPAISAAAKAKVDPAIWTGEKQPTLQDLFAMMPGVMGVAEMLTGRILGKLAPDLLSNSYAIVQRVDPETKISSPIKFVLDSAASIDAAFSDEVSKLLPAAWFAMMVTYKDFFLESALAGASPTTPAT